MVLDQGSMKGLNREPDMCSECFACVKMCPEGAIEARGYADFVPLGATVKPKRGDREIFWEVKFRDGRRLTYTYPIRSTAVGSTEPYKGFAAPHDSALRGGSLAGEEIWLGVDTLPSPAGRE
jgi:adenylylsulfate reductase subunit B